MSKRQELQNIQGVVKTEIENSVKIDIIIAMERGMEEDPAKIEAKIQGLKKNPKELDEELANSATKYYAMEKNPEGLHKALENIANERGKSGKWGEAQVKKYNEILETYGSALEWGKDGSPAADGKNALEDYAEKLVKTSVSSKPFLVESIKEISNADNEPFSYYNLTFKNIKSLLEETGLTAKDLAGSLGDHDKAKQFCKNYERLEKAELEVKDAEKELKKVFEKYQQEGKKLDDKDLDKMAEETIQKMMPILQHSGIDGNGPEHQKVMKEIIKKEFRETVSEDRLSFGQRAKKFVEGIMQSVKTRFQSEDKMLKSMVEVFQTEDPYQANLERIKQKPLEEKFKSILKQQGIIENLADSLSKPETAVRPIVNKHQVTSKSQGR